MQILHLLFYKLSSYLYYKTYLVQIFNNVSIFIILYIFTDFYIQSAPLNFQKENLGDILIKIGKNQA